MIDTNKIYVSDIFRWLLIPFVIGLLTLGNIPGLSNIMIIFGGLVTVTFILYSWMQKLKVQPEVFIYFAWIIWALSGIYFAIDPDTFWHAYFRIIQMGMMIFTVAGIVTFHRDLSPLMFSIALGCFTMAVINYMNPVFISVIENTVDPSKVSLGLGPNEFAYYLLFVIFALFYFWDNRSKILSRPVLIIMTILPIVGIVYSNSRKAFMGIFAFILLWYFFCHFKKQKKNQIAIFITLIIISSSIYFTVDYVLSQTYLGTRLLSTFDSGSEELRITLYEEGFGMIDDSPIFGIGLNQYRLKSVSKMYSHSDYMEVATNTGLIGFILYFSFYLIIWLRIHRIKKMTDDLHLIYILGFLKAVILTVLILGFGRPNISSKLTWIFLAGVVGYTWSMEEKIRSDID